ncbi:MAG: 30S ribosomal protein S4 [Deltaproteobacteria bacterium]|nr:MAG: 30S ribosomal protein S4 [Deltaproteobacteria bacterium]
MARYNGPKGKLARRFGMNVFEAPKYDRLLARRSKPPGQHGDKQFHKKQSDYSLQLQEKQKVRFMYGLQEKQFRRTFDLAAKQKGITGDNLLILLERRLDNVVFRAGFAHTRMQARQMVNHGHLLVNNRRVDIPSSRIKAGDIVSIADKSKSKKMAAGIIEDNPVFHYPEWLTVEKEKQSFTVTRLPLRDDVTKDINEHLIVEFYSK